MDNFIVRTDCPRARSLARLPDAPRWVQARDLLAMADAQVYECVQQSGFVVWHDWQAIGVIVGTLNTLPPAVYHCDQLIVFADNLASMQGKLVDYSVRHAKVLKHSLAPISEQRVERLSLADIEGLIGIEDDLFYALQTALFADYPAVGVRHHGELVAFAYVASQSDRYWHMGIETLPEARRQGFATKAAQGLISVMQSRDKQSLWSAFDDNDASLRLALTLGYQPCDQLWILTAKGAN